MEKSKLEEYRRKLEEHEAKKSKEAKLFSIDQVLAEANQIKEAYVPELNCRVRYGNITLGDLAEINKAKTDEERAIRIVWLMLSKADPNVTLEKIEQLPLETATAILKAILQTPLPQTGAS